MNSALHLNDHCKRNVYEAQAEISRARLREADSIARCVKFASSPANKRHCVALLLITLKRALNPGRYEHRPPIVIEGWQ